MCSLPESVLRILNRIAETEGFVDFELEIDSGSNIGDNFLGELFAVAVAGRQKKDSGKEIDAKLKLLCKLAPASAQRRKEFLSDAVFERESYFYNTVAPAFTRFQQDKGLPLEDQFKAFPKCFEAIHDPENELFIILMEDLRAEGFTMWPKHKPTPTTHCLLFVRELAKFHAISFVMKDQQPAQFEEFAKLDDLLCQFTASPKKRELFLNCYERVIEVLENEHHKKIMKEIAQNIQNYMVSCLGRAAADRFGVVAHGDIWNNNLMFRSNEEVPNGPIELCRSESKFLILLLSTSQPNIVDDIRFLDWQMISYSSPTIDLLYNLFSSTDKKTRDADFGHLMREYHNQLSSNIRKMGSDPEKLFPYEAFKAELKSSGNIGFLLVPMLIQVSLAESNAISDLDQLCEESTDANEEKKWDIIQGFSESGQLIFHKRINECIGDLVEHGYFRKLND